MGLASGERSYAFGRFRADMGRRTLLADGEPARLDARAFDVLTALVERRERLVSKHELLEAVWHKAVEENHLQTQISALRKLLGTDVLATIPGRGYRFTAVLEGDQETALAPADQAIVAPAHAVRTNLPAELAPLYGREPDARELQRLVRAQRLVTIAGAGGIGKTRLGQAVAHALREDFANGVWLVALAPLTDPGLVAASAAQVLGQQLRSTSAPLDELAILLQSQRLLLVLDSCEHLLGAVSQLAQALLSRAPDVHMLVTSQEPLRLPHERLYRLGPLDMPQEGEPISAKKSLEHGAVRLFVARTQALDPRFALDERNVQGVIDICHQLDGLALAIELAAARVPALGVQGVRERLGERLDVLTTGPRIALRRHQTLRAALDWSHALLDEHDQVVVRRLAIFSGGCTIEAVQTVISDELLDEWTVLDAIGRLVDKSLIVADGEDRPRYRMLESARAYALEKLAAAGEVDALARRHARYYVAYAERISAALFAAGGTEDAFIAARAAEFDNMRAALKWALGAGGDMGIALQLLGHSSPWGGVRVARAESAALLTALKQRPANEDLTPQQAALRDAAAISWGFLTAWYSRAGADEYGPWSAARQTLRPLGERWMAYCACLWALINGLRGDLDAARAVLEEARGLEQPDWPAWLPAFRLACGIRISHWTGECAGEIGELPVILARLEREGNGSGRAALRIGTHFAEDLLMRGRLEEGAQHLQALAQQGRRQRRDTATMMLLFPSLILALTELDRLDEAREVVVEAMPLVSWFDWRGSYAPILALFAQRHGRPETAARLTAAGEARRALSGARLELIGRHAQQKVHELLVAAHDDDQLSAWFSEGAALTDEEFDRLVVHEA